MSLSKYFVAAVLVVIPAGCGVGNSGPPTDVPVSPLAVSRTAVAPTAFSASSMAASALGLPETQPSCAHAECIYVANSDSINVYPGKTNGNKAPTQYISGAGTGLDNPYGVAVDSARRVYAVNLNSNSVTVYPAGANGNQAPVRTIGGSFTDLAQPTAIAVSAKGKIYVTNYVGDNAPATLTIFAKGANGNVPPVQVITGPKTGLFVPGGVAVDGKERIYVSYGGVNGALAIFDGNADGNATPLATISGSNTGLVDPSGIAVDSAGNIYVANGGNGGASTITVFAPGSKGNVLPIREIAGADTGLNGANGLALDTKANTYVSNDGGGGSIAVYRARTNGNLPPFQVIVGANAKLSGPRGIAVR